MSERKQNEPTLFGDLRYTLNSHSDRPSSLLKVKLLNSKDNSMIAEDEFEIHANNPIDKIKEKVYKLKFKGGYTSLSVKELVEKSAEEYLLILSM